MKRLLHILSLSLLTTWASAQAITVTDINNNPITDGGSTSVNLSTSELINESYLETKFLVTNNSNSDLTLFIRRTIIDAPTQWEDQLCWPPSCFIMNGTTASTPTGATNRCIVSANSSITNHIEDYAAETNFLAYIKPNIYINGIVGAGQYRYEVVNFNDNSVLFTFDMDINVTLNATTIKKDAAIVLAPNPASDVVTVSIPDNGNGSIQMVDVLGNVVYQADFTGSRKINTAQFKNGVYFVVITSNGVRSNKKLVIRH